MKRWGWLVVLMLIVGLGLLPSACARRPVSPPPSPAPVTEPELAPTVTEVAEGKTLYVQKCAACHGASGEGTTVAPKVAGHSAQAVKLQVRNPVGTMPAFPQAQLGDADLGEIAAFIASLEPAKAPVMEWEKTAHETMHLWMALLSIKMNDPADAQHHLQDSLALIKEPVNKTKIEEALGLLKQGKLHEAEHEIEEIAGSESPSGVTMQRFHLVLAKHGVDNKDAGVAKHHLEHFLTKATEQQKVIAGKALQLIAEGNFHGAEHEVEALLKD